jgi:uncharacterized membrane protein YgcG
MLPAAKMSPKAFLTAAHGGGIILDKVMFLRHFLMRPGSQESFGRLAMKKFYLSVGLTLILAGCGGEGYYGGYGIYPSFDQPYYYDYPYYSPGPYFFQEPYNYYNYYSVPYTNPYYQYPSYSAPGRGERREERFEHQGGERGGGGSRSGRGGGHEGGGGGHKGGGSERH